jgi:hypothetical protein
MQNSRYSFSRILSYMLHPLVIPTLATFAIMMRPDVYSIVLPDTYKIWFISIVFIFTFVLPISSIWLLLKVNAIYSVDMNNRSERTIPLLIACASYIALLFFIKPTGLPTIFLFVLYSAAVALLAGLLINFVYKISLHTLGWSALAATLTSISLRFGTPLLLLISISVMLAGFAGYARLKQNAHNQAQVYLGFVAGISVIILISCLA